MAGANQTHIITDMIDVRMGEIVQEAYERHIHEIKHSLMDSLMQHDPSFFEQLIVDLLIAMNYGYDKSSGVVVGGSHDGGIDGISSMANKSACEILSN